MTKIRAALIAPLLLLATATVAPSRQAAAGPDGPVHVARSFTVLAEAYPTQSAPGTRETEIKVRSASTKAVASNPPVGAFARAAAADLGLAEAYVGGQGPSADADTANRGSDNDVVVDDDGSRMEAHVDLAPSASAIARNSSADGDPGGSGTVASASTANGAGRRMLATAVAEVNDFRAGLFVLGSGRFEGAASIDGTPGGGRATGLIRTSNASYDGIPITIGTEGVQVDESKVPDPMLRAATAAIQEAFSPGGYIDVRVVQPTVEVAPDGSAARVYGGGLHVFLTNNDPAERYFFSYTLLGGTAETILGGELSRPTPDRPITVAPPPPRVLFTPPAIFQRPPARTAPATPTVVEPDLTFVVGTEQIGLRGLWRGWLWALVLVGLAWAAAGALRLPALAPTKQRLDRVIDDLAHRYVRG